MKIKCGPQEVDAIYISFKKGPVQVTTVRLSEDIALDVGPGEEMVGIEVLDASRHLGLEKARPEVVLEKFKAA